MPETRLSGRRGSAVWRQLASALGVLAVSLALLGLLEAAARVRDRLKFGRWMETPAVERYVEARRLQQIVMPHPELIGEMIEGLGADVMQGNLEPGLEAKELLRALLSRVGAGSRLKHGWLTSCGTMANEIALKITRQKKAPATQILAFNDCFAGRSIREPAPPARRTRSPTSSATIASAQPRTAVGSRSMSPIT